MSDMLQSLRDSAPATGEVSPQTVEADLTRGRRGLRQVRRRRVLTASVGLLAAAGCAATMTALSSGTPHPHTTRASVQAVAPARKASASASAGVGGGHAAPALRLGTYTGRQPAGFTISSVPVGWTVASSNPIRFVLAPPGVDPASINEGLPADVANGANGPVQSSGIEAGMISVMLQGDTSVDPQVPQISVSVNGRAGVLQHHQGDFRTVIWSDGTGHSLVLQAPSSGPTDSDLVALADGIRVLPGAQTAGG